MEVIETIVIQNAEVEGKETVVSTVDTDKSKAGLYPLKVSPFIQSSQEAVNARSLTLAEVVINTL